VKVNELPHFCGDNLDQSMNYRLMYRNHFLNTFRERQLRSFGRLLRRLLFRIPPNSPAEGKHVIVTATNRTMPHRQGFRRAAFRFMLNIVIITPPD
jgi:hypothetical protein